MTGTTLWASSHQTIAQQHKQLLALLLAIESRFRTGQTVNRSLVSLLNALAAHLQMHFEFEEADDYFPSLIRYSPRLSSEIEKLVREHEELLQKASELDTHARFALMEQRDSDELYREFSSLRAKLDEHEAREKKVLQDAYCIDIGTKD